MGIKEDREEFNTAGLRGILGRAMKTKNEAFIRILSGGWNGEEVPGRPTPGSGPYLYYRRGYAVLEYANSSPDDVSFKEYKIEV